MKKILVVGKFIHEMYEESFCKSLQNRGQTVERFQNQKFYDNPIGKAEEYFVIIGVATIFMHASLLFKILRFKPSHIFFWRPTIISNSYLKFIKFFFEVRLMSFNNDNPFGKSYLTSNNINQRRHWKYFIKNIPIFDANFVYRPSNVVDYNQAGSPATYIFPPYFLPWTVQPLSSSKSKEGVVFLGHQDNKRREHINFLLDNNINLSLYGDWDLEELSDNLQQEGTYRANGDKYFEIIKSSKIALVFLSDLNEDVYTRRCFEIPACETLMICERTQEIQAFFEEDKEAVYFSSKVELLKKVKFYLENDFERNEIAKAGKKRALNSGYDVDSTVNKYVIPFL